MKKLTVLAALILFFGIVLGNSIIVTADDSEILLDASAEPEVTPVEEEDPVYEIIEDIPIHLVDPFDYIKQEVSSGEIVTDGPSEVAATTLEYTTFAKMEAKDELGLPEQDDQDSYARPYIDGKPYVDTVFNRSEYNNGFEPIWEYAGMYAEVFEVISVERDNDDCDLVTIGDDRFVYQFISDGSDWIAGDFCAVIMAKNGTPEVFDDTVMAAKYIG